jgi:hypothetical protein
MNRGAAYCDCKQQEVSCPCVSSTVPVALDEAKLGEIVQSPLRYMINATGIHRVLLRVQVCDSVFFAR